MVMEERKKEVEEKQAAKVVRRKEIESKLEQLPTGEFLLGEPFFLLLAVRLASCL
jgi:hypothetical protein